MNVGKTKQSFDHQVSQINGWKLAPHITAFECVVE